MAGNTSKKSVKLAKKAAAERVAARTAKKVAQPRTAATKSQSRRIAKPALLAGGNPQIAKAHGDALTFAKGLALADPARLFNSSLEGGVRRVIDIHEGDRIDEKALQALVRAAVALNTSAKKPKRA